MINIQKIRVVCGAQFGSEGKGNVAAWLASQDKTMVCVRVGGPNAGHTVVHPTRPEVKLKFQHLPTGAVHGNDCVIAAGSEVDLIILKEEIERLRQSGLEARVLLDGAATVLTADHSRAETGAAPHGEAGLTKLIGSTGKGVGAARADRIWRRARIVNEVDFWNEMPWEVTNTLDFLHSKLSSDQDLLIEGTQGYGLGLHTRFYPYTTSGDARAIDFLAQVGLCPWGFPGIQVEPWLVARTFPIRVAGNSGPLQEEISWEEVGQKPEYTTVTNKVRRVGRWDNDLVREAIAANGGYSVKLVLTFLDYVFEELADETDPVRIQFIAGDYLRNLERELFIPIHAVGTGPGTIVRLTYDDDL
jgi:adenylosuccinate synthase